MPRTSPGNRGLVAVAALAMLVVGIAGGADARHPAVEWANRQAKIVVAKASAFYRATPADERVTWGGLAACVVLGLGVAVERSVRLRWSRIVPKAYTGRFHTRLVEGKLDRGKSLDFCELNPSPAARVVLAAVRRWGRPPADLERGVALALQIELDRLKRHVGTLRRIAALGPLIGLLGTLMAANRGLMTPTDAFAPIVARSLAALTAGVALAILSLVAYDGLMGRVEALSSALSRLGAEAIDAIATIVAIEPKPAAKTAKTRVEPSSYRPSPHASRAEIPLETD